MNPQTLSPVARAVRLRLKTWYGSRYCHKKWAIAVSGGLDSMALLKAVSELVASERISVLHFNHGARGEASVGDEAFVRETSEAAGFAFFSAGSDGRGRSEEWLRNERRGFLLSASKAWGGEAVLTAHHGSDQFETFLMRVLRGTGLDGLGAIRAHHGGFARPLLGISRTELESFVKAAGISFRYDETNGTDRFLRNRVRQTLVPAFTELAGEYGGEAAFLSRLGETLEEVQAAANWLSAETDRLFESFTVSTPYWLRLSREDLLGLASLWPSRLVGRIAAELGAPSATRSQRERVLAAVQAGQGKFELCGGVHGEVSCGQVFFHRPGVIVPSPSLVRRGSRLECAPLGWKAHGDTAWLSSHDVRFFQPGDRYEGRKLKEWYLERRVPAPERALVPLVAKPNDAEVLWVFPEARSGLVSDAMAFPFSFLSPRRNSPVVTAP